jgi:hypothetical protein
MSGLVAQPNAGHPAIVGVEEIQHLHTVVNVRSGLTRSIYQNPVEHVTPWCVERFHAVSRLDVDLDRFTCLAVRVVERSLGDSRGPLCFEAIGQAPALK